MPISNLTRVESLLLDPTSDQSLESLRDEMNELARLRQGARVQFCKRLALAYMVLIGHRPDKRNRTGDTAKFTKWCTANIKSATGKRYTVGTLRSYLTVGFSTNPEQRIHDYARAHKRRDEKMRKLGSGLAKAITNGSKVIPITQLRERTGLPTNVAQEVNALMHSWENASPQARSQFIYMVAGVRWAQD